MLNIDPGLFSAESTDHRSHSQLALQNADRTAADQKMSLAGRDRLRSVLVPVHIVEMTLQAHTPQQRDCLQSSCFFERLQKHKLCPSRSWVRQPVHRSSIADATYHEKRNDH
jgi:hypothetical protein